MPTLPSRRRFLAYCSTAGLGGTLFPGALYAEAQRDGEITTETIACAAEVAGLDFTEEERQMMVDDLQERLDTYEALREVSIPNEVPPALRFDPTLSGVTPRLGRTSLGWEPPEAVERPSSDEHLAYMTVAELAALLRSGQVTSRELTELYLRRLKRYDPVLQAVVTLTEERALRKAERMDEELAAGRVRGPLHGIPYGAKDLLAVRGYPTTWGAEPYRDQVLDYDAAVIEWLDEAGAVLVAKLTLGALAWGDVWFGGTTKNPWNIEQGSSGSSAGPGSAVAAALVPFAIGSETLGSIVSPSTRNGVTGHRPTFGTVSRYGAMALSWTMDKLGPMTRSAEDCALVYSVLHGSDPRDGTTVESAFHYPVDIGRLRVGYLQSAFEGEYPGRDADAASLEVLCDLDVELEPVSWPDDLPVGAMLLTLEAEAAAAFDELTRSNRDDLMVRQEENAWPHVFRTARLIPAVEFIQANRARTLLMRRMAETMQRFDVVVTPAFAGGTLQITNLTGHPAVVVPNAFGRVEGAPVGSPRRSPASFTFVGQLYGDAEALALAHAYQQATDFHRRRPPIR